MLDTTVVSIKVEVSIDYGETWQEAEIWAKDTP